MTGFPLKIVTPDGLEFDGMAEQLIVRTVTGDMGIMAKHADCVAPLGMGEATVVIDGASHENVPTVPLAALEEDGNTVTVYTAYDAETDTLLNPVRVTTGLSDGTDAEILSGLSVGDSYYYRYADAIAYTTVSGGE